MSQDLLATASQLYTAQRYEEAFEMFRQAGGEGGAYGEAVCLYQLARYAEAREAVGRCLALNPARAEALQLRSMLESVVSPPAQATSPAGAPAGTAYAAPGATPAAGPSPSAGGVVLSAEEVRALADPNRPLSAQQQRPFVGQTDYEGEAALDAAIAAAKECMPEAESAYKPSGKSTASATFAMLVISPLILLLLLIACGGIAVGFALLVGGGEADSHTDSRLLGLGSLLVDVILVVLMFWLPIKTYAVLGKWLKNRNPTLPALLSGGVTFLVGIVLFVPIWGGETLAPTHLTLLFIPIRWVLIILGALVVPFLVAVVTYGTIAGQKFCEITGVFLRPVATIPVHFDFAENALALLKGGAYDAVTRLPRTDDPKAKHCGEIVLWWEDSAQTAFLEMTVHFHGKSKPKKKKVTLEESKDKTTEWLAFSTRLTRTEAEALRSAYAA